MASGIEYNEYNKEKQKAEQQQADLNDLKKYKKDVSLATLQRIASTDGLEENGGVHNSILLLKDDYKTFNDLESAWNLWSVLGQDPAFVEHRKKVIAYYDMLSIKYSLTENKKMSIGDSINNYEKDKNLGGKKSRKNKNKKTKRRQKKRTYKKK